MHIADGDLHRHRAHLGPVQPQVERADDAAHEVEGEGGEERRPNVELSQVQAAAPHPHHQLVPVQLHHRRQIAVEQRRDETLQHGDEKDVREEEGMTRSAPL